jgi:hypothetical protein
MSSDLRDVEDIPAFDGSDLDDQRGEGRLVVVLAVMRRFIGDSYRAGAGIPLGFQQGEVNLVPPTVCIPVVLNELGFPTHA